MVIESPSILITDDDRDFRYTMKDVFQSGGFRIHLAAHGEEAIEIVQSESIHLALLDMHMPRLTGIETIRLVKQLHAPLPCILVSAGLDDEIVEQAYAADAFSVLAKPVRLGEIRRVVARAMEQHYR